MKKKETKPAANRKSSARKDLKTEQPIAEKDEVKQAEERLRKTTPKRKA
jgi:hypothetical protein